MILQIKTKNNNFFNYPFKFPTRNQGVEEK